MYNCSGTKKADKSQISSYTLKSRKLKGIRQTTFIEKKAIGIPELTRREYLKGILKSKMKIVTGQYIFVDKCDDSKSLLTGPKRTAYKECDLPIHVKCAIANELKLDKHFYCCYDCMRDDEMISAGYPIKCVTLYDNEEYVCYSSENDKIQDVISKCMETIMGNKFQPSKDYGARIVHRGN